MTSGALVIPFDGVMKALAAVVCGAFGLMVFLGGNRGLAQRFLALFLGLIALNQGLEAVRAFAPDPALRAWALRWAGAAAALDPFAFHAFASLARGRPTLRMRVESGVILAAGVAVAAWSLFFASPTLHRPVDFVFQVALSTGTALVYTLILMRELRAPPEARDAAWRCLVPALAVVTITPWGNVMMDAFRAPGAVPALEPFALPPHVYIPLVACGFLVGGAGLAGLAWARLRGDGTSLRAALLGVAVGVGVAFLIFTALWRHGATGQPLEPAWETVGRAGAAIRWLVFGALASVALLRHRGREMTLAARRRSARVLLMAALLTLGLGLAAVLPSVTGHEAVLRPLDVLLLGALVMATQGFRSVVDWVAQRVYGLPPPYDAEAAREVYVRAAAQSAASGRSPLRDPHLQRLREELGLDARTAGLLERLAEERAGGPLAVGQVVQGRYHLTRHLGAGGSGEAFLAHDDVLRRDVVLKAIRAEGRASDDALEEARIAGSLQHPNVLTIHDVLARPGGMVLVLEHAPRGTLADHVAAHGRLGPAEGARLLRELLSALEAVHRRGVVHRDVKPHNVFLMLDGTAKLGDFGIARLHAGRTVGISEPSLFVGSPAYMSPEQRRGEPATPRSDLHSLALVARACVEVPEDDARWRLVLDRALAEDPKARWPDASAMLAAARALPQ